MHSRELAHRDVKPQNVLLRQRQPQEPEQQPQQQQAGGGAAAARPYDPMPTLPLVAPREDQSLQRQEQQAEEQAGEEQGWAADAWQSDGDAAGRGAAAAAAAAYSAAGAAAERSAPPEAGQQQRQQQQEEEAWWAERLPSWRREHEAVLMDFGSTRPALVEVRNRAEAMAAQEDAEVGWACNGGGGWGGRRTAPRWKVEHPVPSPVLANVPVRVVWTKQFRHWLAIWGGTWARCCKNRRSGAQGSTGGPPACMRLQGTLP